MPDQVTVLFPGVVEFDAPVPGERRPRTVSGLAVPFGVPSGPSMLDGIRYSFAEPPANAGDLLDVVRGHDDDAVIGRLAAPLDPARDGLHAVARLFATTRGDDALVEAAEGVLAGFSVSAEIQEYTTDPATDVRTVTAWSARHLGLVRRPAFTESRGLTVAASERTPMPETTAPPAPAPHPAPAVATLPTTAELAAEVGTILRAEMAAAQQTGRHPLAQFTREADYWHAFQNAEPEEQGRLRAAFAVPDQITGDSPGVMTPQWRNVIQMRLDDRRPAITGVGTASLPDSGMTSNWPYLDPALSLDGIIAQQAAEKTDLAGVKIKILSANVPIKTAGTVSDISYQLLRRSDPSYLEAYLRICRAAWARYTEAKFEAALVAGGTASAVGAVADANAFRKWLFSASQQVEDATGAPATVVGVGRDTWILLAGFNDLYNPNYGTQNASGTSDASTLRININGLEIRCWPFLGVKKAVVTNRSAAAFAEQGPMVASTEDARKLGQDVAVWGMYVDAEIYFPTGVIVGTIT